MFILLLGVIGIAATIWYRVKKKARTHDEQR